MPRIFKIGGWLIYFWANEGEPVEPVHVHISRGKPNGNATKVWITNAGRCLLCNNNSQIAPNELNDIMDVIEARSFEIISKWKDYYGEIRFYC